MEVEHARTHGRAELSRVRLIAWHLGVGLLGGIIGWQSLQPSLEQDSALRVLSCVLVGLLLWTLASWRAATGRLITPYSAYALAAFLFNGGLAFLWAVGLEGPFTLRTEIAAESIRDALALTTGTLWSLHLGALSAARSRRLGRTGIALPSTKLGVPALRAGIWVTVVALAPALLGLSQSIRLVQGSGYFALYQRDLGTGWASSGAVIANLLIPGLFSILAGATDRGRIALLVAAVVSMWSAALLFVGYRGTAVAIAVAFLWLWTRRVRPIRGLAFAVGIAALLLMVPLVNATRGLTGAERVTPQVYFDIASSLEAPVVAALAEMGGTLGVTAETMELVPATRPFDRGRSYLYAALAVVPNVAWDKHPSMTRGTPSEWFIWTIDRWTAAAGGSRGFSFIAEAYLNFGYFAPFATLAFGLFLGLLERWVDDEPSEAKDAFLASYLVFFLPCVRNDSMAIFRPLLWYAGAPFAATFLFARSRMAARGRTVQRGGSRTLPSSRVQEG